MIYILLSIYVSKMIVFIIKTLNINIKKDHHQVYQFILMPVF